MTDLGRTDWAMLEDLVERAGTRLPDYTEDVIERATRVRQRPAWTFVGQRLPQSMAWPVARWGLVLAVLLLALLAGMLLWAGSAPTPAPRLTGNGPIAVTTYSATQPGHQIVLLDPVSGEVMAGGPTWGGSAIGFSPDGMRFAYLVREWQASAGGADSPEPGRVWVSHADGSGAKPVTGILDRVTAASWSPDGSRLVVSFSDERHLTRIGVAAADGSGMETMEVGGPADSAVWDPAGNRIAFRGLREASKAIWTVTADAPHDIRAVAGQDAVASESGVQPELAWSPDGSRIAYVRRVAPDSSRTVLHVITVDGTGDRVLPVAGHENRELLPQWSPDGRFIAARGETRLVVVAADGSTVRQIGPAPVSDNIGIADIGWSPDGLTLFAGPQYTDVQVAPDQVQRRNPRLVLIDVASGGWRDDAVGVDIPPFVPSGTIAWRPVAP